ncbi:unnamed protein product, partial [Prorocentrum cordatum]
GASDAGSVRSSRASGRIRHARSFGAGFGAAATGKAVTVGSIDPTTTRGHGLGGATAVSEGLQKALSDRQDCRAKIYSVLLRADFQCQEALGIAERQQMEMVKLYPDAMQLESWIEVKENLSERECTQNCPSSEVQRQLRAAKFPIRFVFAAPRKSKAQLEQEAKGAAEKVDFQDDRKMVIMMIGVMNSFNQVSMFDFEWPPIFTKLAAIAGQFSLNFNFFQPECSVETPFIQKWITFLAIPYMMMVPLIIALAMASTATVIGKRGFGVGVKLWLLKNAFARCCCMSVIMLLPFHLDRILVPFACAQRGEGLYFVDEMPETPCEFTDPVYRLMFRISGTAFSIMMFFYSGMIWCVWKSFHWQYGTIRREHIPFYVAMVEVSTFGQRGYIAEARNKVYANICAVRTFDPGSSRLLDREILCQAADTLAHRGRFANKEKGVAYGAGVDSMEGQSRQETIGERLDIVRSTARFRGHRNQHEEKEGNIMTYGWILIINLFIRQLFSLTAIKLTKGSLVVIGAAAQMVVFFINITCLILFKPYKSAKVVHVETILLSALFTILWGAVMKMLLTNNINADKYATTINRINWFIEFAAMGLMLLIAVVPGYQVYQVFSKAMLMFLSPDATLNEIYRSQYFAKQAERAKEDKVRLQDTLRMSDGDPAEVLSRGMPSLSEALQRFESSGANLELDRDAQRKTIRRLAAVLQRAMQNKKMAYDHDHAVDNYMRWKEQRGPRAALPAEGEPAAAASPRSGGPLAPAEGEPAAEGAAAGADGEPAASAGAAAAAEGAGAAAAAEGEPAAAEGAAEGAEGVAAAAEGAAAAAEGEADEGEPTAAAAAAAAPRA